jgi:hypothetical protein
MLVNQQRDRRDALWLQARQAGMTRSEIKTLDALDLDEAERFLENRPIGRCLRDLTHAERMRATCTAPRCSHSGWVDLDRRRWGSVLLREVANRLVCSRCRARGAASRWGPGWLRD